MNNIKAILVCVVGVVIGLEAYSQSILDNPISCQTAPRYTLFVHVGNTLSNVVNINSVNDIGEEINFINGFTTGIYFDIALDDKYLRQYNYTRVGLNYVRKGYHGYENISNNKIESDYIFDYLLIPFNYVYYTLRNNSVDINFNGGIYGGILVNSSVSTNSKNTETKRDIINTYDFGLNGGLEIFYKFDYDFNLGLSYNYQIGLIGPFSEDYLNSTHLISIVFKTH